jgi:hypothetical protein
MPCHLREQLQLVVRDTSADPGQCCADDRADAISYCEHYGLLSDAV